MQGTSREALRVEALRRYAILDTEAEPAFERVVALAARCLKVPISVISFIDETRQWFKSSYGFSIRESPRDESFCTYTILGDGPMVVEDAEADPRFCNSSLVCGPEAVRSYAGMPIVSHDGYALGTLAVLDRVPRKFSEEELLTLVDLAAVVGDLLEARATVLAKRVLDKITRTSPDVIYLYDLERKRTVYRSSETESVPGYDRLEGEGLGGQVHADDAAHVAQHLGQFRTVLDGARRQHSYRVSNGHGGYRWILANEAVFERDERGVPKVLLGVASDITELKKAQAELARLAITDEMTGLPNRRALHERLAVLMAEAARGRKFALVMLDVDDFKVVNDTYGHTVGDHVLREIARALREHVRVTDFVARYGGEEFCILLTDVSDQKAVQLADKLRLAIAAIAHPVPVTASLGVCAVNTRQSSARLSTDQLIHAADDALYRAKRAGKNRVELASEAVITALLPAPHMPELMKQRSG